MAKPVKAVVKLQIAAGKATPAPPIGPSLAQYGLNIGEFCKKFNDETKDQQGWTIPTTITVYEDRSYDFTLGTPPASELLRKIAGVEKGSGTPNKAKVATITKAQLKEIAEKKMKDLNTDSVEQAMRILEGTAKNMGIAVSE